MKTNRRRFFVNSSLAAGAAALAGLESSARAADAEKKSFLVRQPTMRLGTVTYNLGKDWDLETLIKNCQAAKFQGVELRTTHAHGVEVTLSKEQREAVQKKFNDSGVELMGLGSAFDYHTADQEKLKADIEATKKYIILAHDVGATGVKVRPNGFPPSVPQEKTLEQIGRSLRELGAFAEGYGQMIRLEVHGSGTSLLPNIRKIMDVANHKAVGVCWNSNPTDLAGEGFDHNFNLVKNKIIEVHLRDLHLEDYPWRRLFRGLNQIGYQGYCLAEIPESKDPVRVMQYFRSLWLAYQDLL